MIPPTPASVRTNNNADLARRRRGMSDWWSWSGSNRRPP